MTSIFIELNEINFDLVKQYLSSGVKLDNFAKIMDGFTEVFTVAEDSYENNEPWIQWVSVHTGLRFSEHNVFRLGDAVVKLEEKKQIFEILEDSGLRVGAISPMNAINKLSSPAFFIPDPWTATSTDGSAFSNRVAKMLSQTVNDNAKSTISLSSFTTLIELLLKTLNFKAIIRLFYCSAHAKSKKWYKPLILDHIIHNLHIKLLSQRRVDASFVFLNAGAHIQHHYMLNSPYSSGENPNWYVDKAEDPVLDMFYEYDKIIGDYLRLVDRGHRILFATGLSQVPYNRVKFYYRLRDHSAFISRLGIPFNRVLPRMTRDFEIYFDSAAQKEYALDSMKQLFIEGTDLPLFGEIVDGAKEYSLFVSLTYPNEVSEGSIVNGKQIEPFGLMPHVSFVAVKNGMHSKRGYVYYSDEISNFEDGANVAIHDVFQLFKAFAQNEKI